MKHKKFKFLHLMCGKQGKKGRRKLSVEFEYKDADEAYLFGVSIRLIFVFFGVAIEIEKKQEENSLDETDSKERADNSSVQGA